MSDEDEARRCRDLARQMGVPPHRLPMVQRAYSEARDQSREVLQYVRDIMGVSPEMVCWVLGRALADALCEVPPERRTEEHNTTAHAIAHQVANTRQ